MRHMLHDFCVTELNKVLASEPLVHFEFVGTCNTGYGVNTVWGNFWIWSPSKTNSVIVRSFVSAAKLRLLLGNSRLLKEMD